MKRAKNGILAGLYALILGAIVSLIVWGFLRLVRLATGLLWDTIPEQFKIPGYTLIICLLGGLLVGLWRKKTGDYPESMQTVLTKVKKDGKYPYDKLHVYLVSAFLPLIFGASVGPEAGLTGIIAGLCAWVSDKFKGLSRKLKDLTKIGLSATIGTIFNAPMFGFVMPFESDETEIKLPKTTKIAFYFLALFGAMGTLIFLNYLFGGNGGIAALGKFTLAEKEWLWLIPLLAVGVLAGGIYYLSHRIAMSIAKPLKNRPIISCLLSGLFLGLAGMALPLIMFSGEEQISEVATNFAEIGGLILIGTGVLKLFITNTCISLGLKGGHFFPAIFSGICIGYGIGLLTDVNVICAACVVTTTLMSFIMQKPLAVIFLLLLCFSPSSIPIMLLSAVVGTMAGKLFRPHISD